MSSRFVPVVLALHVATVLAGCAAPGPASLQVTPGAAPAKAAQAPATVRPTVSVTRGETPAAPAPAPAVVAPVEPPSQLFALDYSEAQYKASTLEAEDPAAAAELKRAFTAESTASVGSGGFSWGKVGGSIGAGLVGTSLLGYFVYAGMVGSKDLMFPVKTSYKTTPAEFGVPFDAVTFHAHDGLKLAGWYVPASTPTTKGLVVFHGHSSNKDTMFKKYGVWLREKYNLFFYDSRYHGESEGKFTTLGYYEKRDAQIAIDQLRARGNTSIGVLGESMGGAVAIQAAAADKGVKAVWSDCAFDSFKDAIAPRAKARKYPMPDGVAFAVTKMVSLRAKGMVDKADPIKFVDQIAPRPLYLVHGKKDDDTTPVNGEKLFEKAQAPKTMWWTEEADHAESVDKYPEEYKQRALTFFESAL